MSIDEMITVLQAAKAGKQIEWRRREEDGWQWVDSNPTFNFGVCDYRVKPEPREWWVVVDGDLIWPKNAGAYKDRLIKVREVLE